LPPPSTWPILNEVSEARAYPRYEVQATVDVTGTEVLLYHKIQNLSLGGICIQTATIEDVGALVDVIITFPELGEELTLTGQVVWANREPPGDMGIRWLSLDDARAAVLERYLEQVRAKTDK
jgi:uncharacterized protein (TIGR02266 family)